MDRSRNVLNMLMMNFYCILIVPVLWMVVGYTLAQGGTGNFIGNFEMLFLKDVGILEDNGGQIATIAFLGMFACITPALISGAVADRMKFAAWALFVPLWLLLVFVPIFKWIYGGWLGDRGSLDFAGGTAIHVNAGIAALAAGVGARQAQGMAERGAPTALDAAGDDRHRHLVVRMVRLQRRLGTRCNRSGRAGVHEHVPRCRRGGTGVGDHRTSPRRPCHKPGAASGIVAGLVAITPGAGFVSGGAPLAIGAVAGACVATR
jgi:Amt family ammonium transporter